MACLLLLLLLLLPLASSFVVTIDALLAFLRRRAVIEITGIWLHGTSNNY